MENLKYNQSELNDMYYKIVPHEGASIVAVIFATVSVKPWRFSFYKNMEGQSVHRIYINDPNNGWYQNGIPGLGNNIDETIGTLLKWKERLGAKEIVTIGSSMGGYGAILYGAKLGCRVLSFGAETILRLPGSRSLKNMPPNSPIYYQDLKPLLKNSNAKITLITGEVDQIDLISAKNIYELENTNVITIRGVAHGAPVFLEKKFKIVNIFRDYLLNDSIPNFVERGNLCACGNAVELLTRVNKQIAEKQWEAAKNTLKDILKITNNSDVVFHKLGIVMYQMREIELAMSYQSKAIEISSHFANAHHQLGIALRKLGRYMESYQAHKKSYENDPNFAGAYHHAGLSLEKLGEINEAESAFREAVNLDKNNKNFKLKLAEFLRENAIKRLKESEEVYKSLIK